MPKRKETKETSIIDAAKKACIDNNYQDKLEKLVENMNSEDKTTVLISAVENNESESTLVNLSVTFGDGVIQQSLIKLAEVGNLDGAITLANVNPLEDSDLLPHETSDKARKDVEPSDTIEASGNIVNENDTDLEQLEVLGETSDENN